MSADHLASSFGDPNEASSWTPRYAEDYSVFNATPGNLRGAEGPFVDFLPATPGNHLAASHKRLLSAEGFAAEIATNVNHFSPNSNASLPPVDPSKRLLSSPASSRFPRHGYSPSREPRPNTSSSKKARRATITETGPIQTVTPPPSAHKGGHKLAPKLRMQNDQSFEHMEFMDPSQQQQDMAAMMANHPGDMFGYPMSAPVDAPANFWDPSVSMSMNMDFLPAGVDAFQQANMTHDPSASFDWNSNMNLFLDPNAPLPPPSSNQENIQPARHEQPLAPKPPETHHTFVGGSAAMPVAYPVASMEDPFALMSQGHVVDPGLLFDRPHTAAMDTSFNAMSGVGTAEAALVGASRSTEMGEARRASGMKDPRAGRLPDRAYASSPIKPSARPGLSRSLSESRGKTSRGRGPLPVLAPAVRPAVPQTSGGSGVESSRPTVRTTGRASPLKKQHRLSGLASIPELASQPRSQTAVRFTIDARGRARAESMVVSDGPDSDGGIHRSQSSRELRRDNWESSDDESSTDDEPIIIPSRNNSFNASFALPDPRKPVGSIFHSSKRSISDRSTSTLTTTDGLGPGANGGESEAETVMDEHPDVGGDATSELRKVVEDRQKRTMQAGSGSSQRFASAHRRSFDGSISSQATMSKLSYVKDGHGTRCVCNRNEADDSRRFMVQCESCEMWLHGRCITITKRTLPRVYICAFCAETPNMRGGRMRDAGPGRANPLGLTPASSPLASKSFRSFR